MNNATANEIIKRIKEKRIEKGLSYQQLADITKMSKSTLQRYETGEIENIPLHRLEVLANALGCTPAYLMGWEDEAGDILQGEIIKGRRLALGFSQEEVAEYVGVDVETIEKWETERFLSCDGKLLNKLLEILKTSLFFIAGLTSSRQEDTLHCKAAIPDKCIEAVEEMQLLQSFRSLDEEGKNKVLSYIEDIAPKHKTDK
ncbi:MAG: helix-turn-helix transcriptional regulator [Clostridiales bacterium]